MPDALSQIVIVGPGRLGRTAARILASRGFSVQLCGRNDPVPTSPLTWLTVPDGAIATAAEAVPRGGVVLHASGATEVEALRPHRPAGVLHPLMTFPDPTVDPPPDAPASISGDAGAVAAAEALAFALGFQPFRFEGNRVLYHAAAVMAGNYTTVLLSEAESVLRAAGVDHPSPAGLLAPLMLASAQNAARLGPAQTLTGPASRGDEATIERHLSTLKQSGLLDQSTTYEALLLAARRLAKLRED